ncbi:MAG: nucleoside hydrolase [Bacillota bacterium]|nr:nucleoside hydrolase [Bacillota bacterium]
MRKIIIDTDTGSDDAVAMIMALKDGSVKVEAITTVCGNVPLEKATKNALATVEIVGKDVPVYVGAPKPLMRELVTAQDVHGQDGMGDCNLINPKRKPEKKDAVEKILELVNNNPNEIEIMAIGPATNIASAILRDPETMKKVKHIYSMGTAGFGFGNITPVAEFNVYADAEAYKIMVEFDVPLTIVGFDLCLGEAALNKEEIDMILNSGKKEATFAMECNKRLLQFNVERTGDEIIDLPDPVSMAVLLWEDIVLEAPECYCYTCIKEEATYGQVIIHDWEFTNWPGFDDNKPNAKVIKKIDHKKFKEKLIEILLK